MTKVWTSEFTVPATDRGGTIGINGFFIRLHSWDERDLPRGQKHKFFRSLMGRRIRVTIETLD